MASTLSPNMNLIIPGVGSEQGPTYALDLNSSLTLVDQHDHSLGSGVQITPAGININAALTLNDNNLTLVKSAVFVNQTAISTLQALYVKPGSESPAINDLWYNDGNGTPIQLTSAGAVNASIANLPGESFDGTTFTWKQGDGSTTPANFDIGSINLRPNTPGTVNGVFLQPPSAISSQYDIFLPILPATNSFMAINAAGVITASPAVLGALTTANLSPTAGITLQQLAAAVLQWNTQTFTVDDTFIVPANVNVVYAYGSGGGGGGGGGGGRATGSGGGGGAGGGGALPNLIPLTVTPGETITITIGAGGAHGSGGSAGGGNGGDGVAGGDSVFDGNVGTISFPGGAGGQGGRGSVAGNAGGVAGSITWWNNPAGNGGTTSVAGSAGTRSAFSSGGSGGATTNGGGGGGGGGASLGAPANGGAGGNGPGAGGNAGANTAAGGGGGGARGNSGGSAAIGGDGGSGQITLYWLGAP